MLRSTTTAMLAFLSAVLFATSCKRELSCENCNNATINNKPPVAIAGADQNIALPKDSVLLDGSASNDPDGTITQWQWTKLSGPSSSILTNNTSAKTTVKNLSAGLYSFELTVTDNGGLSGKDTIAIRVDSIQAINQPPLAYAGSDQIITLPVNEVTLDGSGSTDPDGIITSFQWAKLSGPVADFSSAGAALTKVTGLQQGTYFFELTVTDNGGLFAKDTVQVTVNAGLQGVACDGSSRPTIAAKLTLVGTLPTPRDGMTLGAVGTKIVFAGGVSSIAPTDAIDIFDTVTRQWTSARLSQARVAMAAATAGNKLFLAGGNNSEGDINTPIWPNIDVYDAGTDTWSMLSLSERRGGVAAAALGNKVFFAGGGTLDYYNTTTNFGYFPFANTVDIYDLSTSTWSTASLSQARSNMSAVVAGNKIYFAGGFTDSDRQPSNRIDIYDGATQLWSSASLLRPRRFIGGAAVNNHICWAEECSAETRNTNTGIDKEDVLSHQGWWYGDLSINAVVKDNNIVFFHQQNQGSDGMFDIYNTVTDTWQVGVLPQKIGVNAIISVNNTIYLVGGANESDYKSKVWRVDF